MEVKEETPEEAAQMADSGGEIVEPPAPAPAAAQEAAQEDISGWDERHRIGGYVGWVKFGWIVWDLNLLRGRMSESTD